MRNHFFNKDASNSKMQDDPSVAVGTRAADGEYFLGETAVDHVWQLQYVTCATCTHTRTLARSLARKHARTLASTHAFTPRTPDTYPPLHPNAHHPKRYQMKTFTNLLANAIGAATMTDKLFWEIVTIILDMIELVNKHEVLQLVHTVLNDERAWVTLGFIHGIPLRARTGREVFRTSYSFRMVRTGLITRTRASIATAFSVAIDAGIKSYAAIEYVLFGEATRMINDGMIEYGEMTKLMACTGVIPVPPPVLLHPKTGTTVPAGRKTGAGAKKQAAKKTIRLGAAPKQPSTQKAIVQRWVPYRNRACHPNRLNHVSTHLVNTLTRVLNLAQHCQRARPTG